jgi:hypothetical protein
MVCHIRRRALSGRRTAPDPRPAPIRRGSPHPGDVTFPARPSGPAMMNADGVEQSAGAEAPWVLREMSYRVGTVPCVAWADTKNPNVVYPKIVHTWQDAEKVSAAWIRRLGYPDAEVSPPGSDNGVDVRSVGAVAQVKCWARRRVGIREVQRIAGSAEPGQACAVFSTSGYTRKAYEWACVSDREVALFRLRRDGTIRADNRWADLMLCRAPIRLPVGSLPPVNSPGEVAGVLAAAAFVLFGVLAAAGQLVSRGPEGLPSAGLLLVVSGVWLLNLHFQFRGLRRALSAIWRAAQRRSLIPLAEGLGARRVYRDAGTPPDLFVGIRRSGVMRTFDALEGTGRPLRQIGRRWRTRRIRGRRARIRA